MGKSREGVRRLTAVAERVVGAMEIGGTHVAVCGVDVATATVLPQTRHRRELASDGDRDNLLATILRAAVDSAVPGCTAWGVAVPGPFDYDHGICRIRGVGKLEVLLGVDLRGELGKVLGVPQPKDVVFINDADAFLLGEWWVGAARGHPRAVGITLGTGLGSAFLRDGRIVDSGPTVPADGRLDLVPFEGRPVEDVISRRGILQAYGAGPDTDVIDIAARARMGEQRAMETFERLGSSLGAVLAPWLTVFAPTCLVVGGSIAGAWDLMLDHFMRACPSAAQLQACTVAANLDEAALLGAAYRAARLGL